MTLELIVVRSDDAPLPPGSSVRVEVRDTSVADAPAVTLHRTTVNIPKTGRTMTSRVSLEMTTVPDGATVWAHVDADRDGRVSVGDYISMESYPVSSGAAEALTIKVKKVS